MNRERICRSLQDDGYDAALTDGGSRLTVVFEAGGRLVKLVHFFPEELLRVPRIDLVDGHGFGKLAHVLASGDHSGEGGEVCIGDVASTSINVDCPELVYRDTLEEHVLLLTRLIEEPAYNRDEQLREFDAHWSLLCPEVDGDAELYVAWDETRSESLQVKPSRGQPDAGIRSSPINGVERESVVRYERPIGALFDLGENSESSIGKRCRWPKWGTAMLGRTGKWMIDHGFDRSYSSTRRDRPPR